MSHKAEPTDRVDDPEKIGKLRDDLALLVRRLSDGSLLVRKRKGSWLAIPVESGFHLTVDDATQLANAIGQAPHPAAPVYGILLEGLEGVAPVVTVPATAQGLMDFSKKMAHFNVALMPGDASWVVALTTDDYFLVVGAKSFLKRAAGASVEEAYRQFHEFAGECRPLLAVLDAAECRYSKAKAGRWVIFPGQALRSLEGPDLVKMEEVALRV